MLRHVLTEPIDDFQDWPPWRQLVVETAAQVHRYMGSVLVIPMTLLHRDCLREIFDGPASHDLEVRHFLVHADPDELARRINHDQGVPGQTRQWRLDHLPTYQQARPWLTSCADLIDTAPTLDGTIARCRVRAPPLAPPRDRRRAPWRGSMPEGLSPIEVGKELPPAPQAAPRPTPATGSDRLPRTHLHGPVPARRPGRGRGPICVGAVLLLLATAPILRRPGVPT